MVSAIDFPTTFSHSFYKFFITPVVSPSNEYL